MKAIRLLSSDEKKLYAIWRSMKNRCRDPGVPSYDCYGGRGISVCERWAEYRYGFWNFVEDMGPRPVGASLGRRDNNRGYNPNNCRWETRKEQARNKQNTCWVIYRGQAKPLVAWCEELGIDCDKARKRLGYGWSIKRVLETP